MHGSPHTGRQFTRNRVLFAMLLLSLTTETWPQQHILAQDTEPPVAVDDWDITDSHTSLIIDVLANDFEMSAPIDPTSVTIREPTETGSTDVDPQTGMIQFIPDPGASINDYLVYEVSDQDGRVSNAAFLWISVMHDPPFAENDSAMTPYTESIEIDVLSNDLSGTAAIDPGSVQIVTQPQSGNLVVNSATGAVTYTPGQFWSAGDSFEYIVEDIDGVASNVAQVDISIENQAPMIDWFDSWMDSAGTWVFEGELTDENPATVSVELGGLIDATVVPDSNGYFQHTENLPPQAFGIVTATATDETGLESGTETTSIYQY